MKKTRFTLMPAALSVIFAASFLLLAPSRAYAAEDSGGSITVSGTGSVNINPDVAYASLGVSTHEANAKTAMSANNTLMEKVIAALEGLGIAERDIRTTGFTMNPSYDYSNVGGRERITGYHVSNQLTVVVRDISIIGDVLGEAAEAGANIFNNVEFAVLDESAAYNEALALAMENAGGKAQALADTLGKTATPVSVSENSYSSYYTPIEAGFLNTATNMADGSVPMQSGKRTVTAAVTVIYEFVK
ncbi:MAG: SIMPL domain-containing protein [Clostridiales bacterium]|jgi:uncharacterized protein YggE|nr:SIMPL domain-containing protein [Clostridiales bacterium]